MTNMRFIFLTLLVLQLSCSAYAGSVQSQICVNCTVVKGKPTASFAVKNAVTKPLVCATPISNKKNHVGDYDISCPKGGTVCLRQSVTKYIESADGTLVRTNELDPEKDKIYTDSECTELWDPSSEKTQSFTKDGERIKGSLFCKRSIKDNKEGESKTVTVLDLTVMY